MKVIILGDTPSEDLKTAISRLPNPYDHPNRMICIPVWPKLSMLVDVHSSPSDPCTIPPVKYFYFEKLRGDIPRTYGVEIIWSQTN